MLQRCLVHPPLLQFFSKNKNTKLSSCSSCVPHSCFCSVSSAEEISTNAAESLQVPDASAGVCDLGPPASFHPPVMGMSADVLVAAAPQVRRLKKKLKLENEAEYAELYRRPRQCCIRFNLDAVDWITIQLKYISKTSSCCGNHKTIFF